MSQVGALEVQLVACDVLELWPDNPRQGDVGAIAESLSVHGQYDPLVVQASTMRVMAGNHRLMAARQLGWKQVAVIVLDVDDETARRIFVVDNRTSDLATYDNPQLAELLTDLASRPAGLLGTGFDGDDLDQLLRDLATPLAADWMDAFEQPEGLDRQGRRNLSFALAPGDADTLQAALDAYSQDGAGKNTAIVRVAQAALEATDA